MASREAMLAARDRRITRFDTRLQWYGDRVLRNINLGMISRLKIVAQLVRDRVVINISIPVVKEKSKITKRIVVTERSAPSEFPRADTTRLMKDIFWEAVGTEYNPSAIVGTTLDYGLWLEIRMQRSFLRRTLLELSDRLGLILAHGDGTPLSQLPGQDMR